MELLRSADHADDEEVPDASDASHQPQPLSFGCRASAMRPLPVDLRSFLKCPMFHLHHASRQLGCIGSSKVACSSGLSAHHEHPHRCPLCLWWVHKCLHNRVAQMASGMRIVAMHDNRTANVCIPQCSFDGSLHDRSLEWGSHVPSSCELWKYQRDLPELKQRLECHDMNVLRM